MTHLNNKKTDNHKSYSEHPTAYRQYTRKKKLRILFFVSAAVVSALFALTAGAADVNLKQTLAVFLGIGDAKANMVVLNLRLPRITAGLIAGMGLGISGCIMQNNLRNPLASPSTLGISSAAAFGANVAIIIFSAGSILTTGFALGFSLMATALILSLSKLKKFSPESIVLAGVAISSLFSAGTMIVQYFAQDTTKVAAVIFWTFGDLGRTSREEILIMGLVVVTGFVYFIFHRWDYNAIDSGEETAKSLGINIERVRLGGMLYASVITAVCVSFLGIIGFIGLVAPQICIRIIGNDKRFLIPASAAMGAFILLLSDTAARILLSPQTLPVGAVTSFLGAPLFLYLLIKGGSRK